MNKNLILRKICIHQDCNPTLLKVLNPGEYQLSSKEHDNFFLEGVNISAIVGENGSGKSSIIELLFRMVNNLAAVMLKDFERPAAEYIIFVEGLVADLHYTLDGVDGLLSCKNTGIKLTWGQESYEWTLNPETFNHTSNGVAVTENAYQSAVSVAKHFFYLIATNYSMQSYVTNDYRHEKGYRWSKADGQNTFAWHEDIINCWMNGVFHKNDGYLSPIVLNPYRDEGNIDMNKEERLTTNRLCALLLHTRNSDFQLVEGYRLSNIKYLFTQEYLYQKFDKSVFDGMLDQTYSGRFLFVYNGPNSYAKSVLDGYGLTLDRNMNLVEITLRIYLVYKTFSIAKKYPQYNHFQKIGDVNNTFRYNQAAVDLSDAKKLAIAVKSDGSHIALKVQQTLTLIKNIGNLQNKPSLENQMTYDEMLALLEINPVCESIEDLLAILPPPVFRPQIYLIKEADYEWISKIEDENERTRLYREKEILMNHLSSGERQFIYNTSTLLYHAFNLLSVPTATRLSYRNICVVLEEVEICFHPEYQRTFINKLIGLLERTKLNKHFGFNIIVVTHSPFVLSDIPRGNILFIKNGENVTDKMTIETFGANVNELLAESFFLSSGFMGEFAKKKIISLVEYLQSSEPSTPEWNRDSASKMIEIIGDDVIKLQLRNMFVKKFSENENSYTVWLQSECRRMGI